MLTKSHSPFYGPKQIFQSDNDTVSVVYTSRKFQPYAESFSEHYAFVGPSVFSTVIPQKGKKRPLLYISMGTVINDRPDFYSKCIDAFRDIDADGSLSVDRRAACRGKKSYRSRRRNTILLRDDSPEGIRIAVQEILNNATYAKAANECSLDFRACSGPIGAAEFIENAPHQS